MSEITRKALGEGLKKLMESKPLSKITVIELVSFVGVSRHTFYYHFRDIYTLALWVLKSEANAYVRDKRQIQSWRQGFAHLCRYLQLNRKFVLGIYRSECKSIFIFSFYESIRNLINEVVELHSASFKASAEQRALVCDFYSHAFSGVIVDWIDNNMAKDADFIINTIATAIQGEILDALERLSK